MSRLSKEQVAKDLADYKTMHGFTPSLERLFTWRTEEGAEQRLSLTEEQESSNESL